MRNRMLLPLVGLLCVAGCGKGEAKKATAVKVAPEVAVRATLVKFRDASATRDYQTICDELLAKALVDNVTQYGLPCELALKQGLGEVRDPKLTVGRVTVNGSRASARVTTGAANQKGSTDTISLLLVGSEWRIASLG